MENDETILELDNEYVLYHNEKSNYHGESLSINIFDGPSNPESSGYKIGEWLAKNGGSFSDSETKINYEKYSNLTYTPFYFKITSRTRIIDLDGKRLSKDELIKGTNIGLVARAVPYEYEERSGVMRLLETIVVYEPKRRTQTNLEHIKRMRAERTYKSDVLENGNTKEAKPITDKEADKKSEPQTNANSNDMLSLDEIPF